MQTARGVVAFLFALFLTLTGAPALAKNDLVIGVAQSPLTLLPYVNDALVGHYVFGFTTRKIIAFDKGMAEAQGSLASSKDRKAM